MKKAPNILSLKEVYVRSVNAHTGQGAIDMVKVRGRYVLSRFLGMFTLRNRIKAAWLVFTGQADALVWPEDDPDFNGMKVPE